MEQQDVAGEMTGLELPQAKADNVERRAADEPAPMRPDAERDAGEPAALGESVRGAAEYADVIDLDWDRLDVGDDVIDVSRD